MLSATLFAQAQTYIANDDNFFVKPNATATTSLDILLNDYYGGEQGCTLNELTLSFPGTYFCGGRYYTTKGVFTLEAATKRLQYQPNTNQSGTDSFTYQFECNASGSPVQRLATVYIHINDKPSVISEANCYVEPSAMTWGIAEIANSNDTRVIATSNIWTGDIDGDGKIEIIGLRSSTPDAYAANRMYNGLAIYVMDKDMSDNDILRLKYDLVIEAAQAHPHEGVAIANVDGGKTSALFFTSHTGVLYKYIYDEATNNFIEDKRVTFGDRNLTYHYRTVVPIVADLMGNGRQQIILLDKIYDASTLELLVDAQFVPDSGRSTYSFGSGGHLLLSNQWASCMIAADIDNDGVMELIGGDCVYKVNIDYSNFANNQYYLYRRANKDPLDNTTDLTIRGDIYDGLTGIADMDNDGLLDVIISSPMVKGTGSVGSVYIYNPRTGEVIHTNIINNIPKAATAGPSMPFIGDIDADGYPEICLTGYLVLNTYDYDPSTKTLSLRWSLPTTDTSASTTISLFDFTQSGKAQLIYRDQTEVRIIEDNVTSSITKATFSGVYSPTINEYCIVADVNGDGAAEIISAGSDALVNPSGDPNSTANYYGNGSIRVYASTTTPWAPTRSTWNQVCYNPVYVNDDLTIPAKPISPATTFYGAGGVETRPFNNFLQQATSLNREGTMIMLGPDLQFDMTVPKRLSYDNAGNVNVSVGIINRGDAAFSGPIYLALYAQSGATYQLIGDYTYANAAGLGYQTGSNTVTLNFSVPESAFPASYDLLYITVNLSSNPGQTPVFKGSDECHGGYNNIGTGLSLINGELVLCEGQTGDLAAYPENTYFLKWYDKSGTLLKSAASKTDNKLSVTKNSQQREFYLVESYASATSTQPVSSNRDSVFVYLSPTELNWTGSANSGDWHNYQNWSNPNSDDYPQANIPRSCTRVFIPAGLSYYPDLTDKTAGGNTDYSNYANAVCDSIGFAHGGELQHPDKLTYNKAGISATFNSHHWYAMAPPLKNFYTRDFHYNNIVPKFDDIHSYTRGWARRNPQNNYYEVNWTKVFNTPNTTFEAGQGFSLWIDDKSVEDGTTPLPHAPFSFEFPRTETEYWIYDIWMGNPLYGPYAAPRADSHRFIFDTMPDASGNFKLKVDNEAPVAGDLVLVANPFMANLDFDKFYAANSALINDYYYIPDDLDNWTNYYNSTTPAASTIGKYIAPMQAFMVRLKTAAANLNANGNMTVTNPGNKIKNAVYEEDTKPYLIVEARQKGYSSKAYIGFGSAFSDNFSEAEDTPALFAPISEGLNGIIISSSTADGMKTFINNYAGPQLNEIIIPLSIRTLANDDVTLNISNLPSILSLGYKVGYYDALTRQTYDASLSSMKAFSNIQPAADAFIDDRIYIQISKELTSVGENVQPDKEVVIKCANNTLAISSIADMNEVRVYNLEGIAIHTAKPEKTKYEITLPHPGVYIVKVTVDGKNIVRKIINN